MDAGPEQAGRLYWCFGSATGNSPGLTDGTFLLPLNPDPYFALTLLHPNTLMAGSLGILDAKGRANAKLLLPANLSDDLAGLTLHHAFAVYGADGELTYVSRAEPLELLP